METNKFADMKKRTFTNLMWRFAERCGAQLVSFVVSVVLARLLSPNDYGLVAMITIFISISQVFIDSGMASALIQKENADDLDFSSVFYVNVVLCIIIYMLLFVTAPIIASFYNVSELTVLIRVLGVTIIVSAMKNVQQAYVSKHLLFKKFFYATLSGTLIAAIVGIVMAYRGCGVWALIVQQLVNVITDTIVLWLTVKWRPRLLFSLDRVKQLFSYGWKILVSSLINTIYMNLRQLVIGKVYSSTDLAYYNKGKQFPNLIVNNINTSIDSVLFPVLSSQQKNVSSVKRMTRKAIRTSSYIMWPLMIGLFVIAEPLIRLLLTEKWMETVPYMRIFCIDLAFQPIQTANLNAIKAMGRSDLFLKLEIVKKSIGLIMLAFVLRKGVFVIALSVLVYSFIAQIINSSPNRKLLKYGYIDQLKDILPYVTLSVIMGIVVYPIALLQIADICIIALQVLMGMVVYILLSILFKIEVFYEILNLIKNIGKKKS